MPELPEVETVVRDLRPLLTGRTFDACDLRFPAIVRFPEPDDFARDVVGQTVTGIERRGKYMFIRLESGPAMVVHLGMSGKLLVTEEGSAYAPHTHAELRMDDGLVLRYVDPRRFGRLLLGTDAALRTANAVPELGPEPLDPDFTAADLCRRLAGRRAPLKSLLLDQKVVAGVGNIYADEACFRARVRPDRPATRLTRPAVARLHRALGEVLLLGIANRGSTVGDFVDAHGRQGRHQSAHQVYGRGGEPCFECGRPLTSRVIGGRTTVFCRSCQK